MSTNDRHGEWMHRLRGSAAWREAIGVLLLRRAARRGEDGGGDAELWKVSTGLSSAAFDQTKGWANQTGKQDEGNKASQGRR